MATNTALESKAIDKLLSATQLPAAALDGLKNQFSQSALLLGAGWHGPTDIKTLVGLQGQFLWPEDVFNVGTIRFTFDADKIATRVATSSPGAGASPRKGRSTACRTTRPSASRPSA